MSQRARRTNFFTSSATNTFGGRKIFRRVEFERTNFFATSAVNAFGERKIFRRVEFKRTNFFYDGEEVLGGAIID